MYTYLIGADEIITFNGRKCDLVVLEHQVGEEAMETLWRKPHHDLTGWRGSWKLKEAIAAHLPAIAPSFETFQQERRAEIGTTFADVYIASDLAGTYRDVRVTYALFQLYLDSGNSDQTFRDLV